MSDVTKEDAEAMVALIGWLRNPWINAAPENERGPLPEWVYALMHEAADVITALVRLREEDKARIERLEAALREMVKGDGWASRIARAALEGGE